MDASLHRAAGLTAMALVRSMRAPMVLALALLLPGFEADYEGTLESVDFAPRNMSRIMLQLRLAFLPEPAQTGT